MTSFTVKMSLAALVIAGASAFTLSSAQALTTVDRGVAAREAPSAEKVGWGCGPYGCRRWGGYGGGGRPRYWGGGGGYGYGYPRYYGGGYGWRPRYWGGGQGWGGGWGGRGYGGGWGGHW